MFQRGTWRIVRGDLVRIIAGRCKGEHGQVLNVIRDPRRPRVIVEGHNLVSIALLQNSKGCLHRTLGKPPAECSVRPW